jgi:hypothetical protein
MSTARTRRMIPVMADSSVDTTLAGFRLAADLLVAEGYDRDPDYAQEWRTIMDALNDLGSRGSSPETEPDHAFDPVQTIEGICCRYCKGPEASPRHYAAHDQDEPAASPSVPLVSPETTECTCPNRDTMVASCPVHGDAPRLAGTYRPASPVAPLVETHEIERATRILDWIGVAIGMVVSERVKWLAIRLAVEQGGSLDEAEALASAAAGPSLTTDALAALASSQEDGSTGEDGAISANVVERVSLYTALVCDQAERMAENS